MGRREDEREQCITGMATAACTMKHLPTTCANGEVASLGLREGSGYIQLIESKSGWSANGMASVYEWKEMG